MTFQRDIYPHRHDVPALTERLLSRLEAQFTRITPPPDFRERTHYSRADIGGHAVRCHNASDGWFSPTVRRCNWRATPTDKLRARSLMRAWRGDLSGRHLDAQLLRMRENVDYPNPRAAFDDIRRNVRAGGIVKTVADGLYRTSLPLFGGNIPRDLTYNQFYTSLIIWDDDHLSGALERREYLEGVMSAADGGERALPMVHRGAIRFVSYWQRYAGPGTPSVYRGLLGLA